MECLKKVLENAFGSGSPAIINLRDALSDHLFHDTIHPKREGRFIATRSLD